MTRLLKPEENSDKAPVAQWTEQRFPKAPPGATWADPAGFSGCEPLGAAGFGQIPTGQLVIDVTSNWGVAS